jgi:hypothetical protein
VPDLEAPAHTPYWQNRTYYYYLNEASPLIVSVGLAQRRHVSLLSQRIINVIEQYRHGES